MLLICSFIAARIPTSAATASLGEQYLGQALTAAALPSAYPIGHPYRTINRFTPY